MDIKKIFGSNLKKYRKALGYTQIQLAEILNVEQKHISFIESGNSFPSAGLIDKITKTLNIQPKNLFNNCPEPTPGQMKQNIINILNNATIDEIKQLHNYAAYIHIKNICDK